MIDSTERFVITTLLSGSFFGDYNVLFNVKNNFGYRVGDIPEILRANSRALPFYSETFSRENLSQSTMFYTIKKGDFMNIS